MEENQVIAQQMSDGSDVENSEASNQASTDKSFPTKVHLYAIIAALLLVIIGLSVALLILPKSNQAPLTTTLEPTPLPSASAAPHITSDKTNWLEYQSPRGFTFQYPPTVTLNPVNDGYTLLLSTDPSDEFAITILSEIASESTTLEEYIQSKFTPGELPHLNIQELDTGTLAGKLVSQDKDFYNQQVLPHHFHLLKHENLFVQIYTNQAHGVFNGETTDSVINPDASPTIAQILSTFEFTSTSQSPSQSDTKTFKYQNFTISYPSDWRQLELVHSEGFPLRERLASLYDTDKVVAFEKDNLYLIVTTEPINNSESGGIFINDALFNEFIADKDEITIGTSTFYLSQNHQSIPSLEEAHSGPYGWSALFEYVPNKQVPSGEIYKGSENIIKRNGYIYNFILVSQEEGKTSDSLQQELISILESIQW